MSKLPKVGGARVRDVTTEPTVEELAAQAFLSGTDAVVETPVTSVVKRAIKTKPYVVGDKYKEEYETVDTVYTGRGKRAEKNVGTNTTIPFYVEQLVIIAEAAEKMDRSINSFAQLALLKAAKEILGEERYTELENCKINRVKVG